MRFEYIKNYAVKAIAICSTAAVSAGFLSAYMNPAPVSADDNLYIFKKQPSSDPSISAASVNISFDATSGEISYNITNAVEGAAVEATTTNDWISNVSVNESTKKVSFSTTINEGVANRVGTITLNYKKAGETLAT